MHLRLSAHLQGPTSPRCHSTYPWLLRMHHRLEAGLPQSRWKQLPLRHLVKEANFNCLSHPHSRTHHLLRTQVRRRSTPSLLHVAALEADRCCFAFDRGALAQCDFGQSSFMLYQRSILLY